jgi:hypothetical protein
MGNAPNGGIGHVSKGNRVVSVRLDDDEWAFVEKMQMMNGGCTPSDAVRHIIRNAIEVDNIWPKVLRSMKDGRTVSRGVLETLAANLFPTFETNKARADKHERGRKHVITAAEMALPRTVGFSEKIDNRTAAGEGFNTTRRTRRAGMDGDSEYDSIMPQGGRRDMRSDNPAAGERDKQRRQRLRAAGDDRVMSAREWGDTEPRRRRADAA